MLHVKIPSYKEYTPVAHTVNLQLASTLQHPAEPIHHPITGKTLAGRGSGISPKTPAVTQTGYHPTTQNPLAGHETGGSVVAHTVQATYLAGLPESNGPTSMMGGHNILAGTTPPTPVTKANVGVVSRATLAAANPAAFLPVVAPHYTPSSPPPPRLVPQNTQAGRPSKLPHAFLTYALILGAVGAAIYYGR